MHDLPAWATERPRASRQYVIGKRRCRQRLAQGLAAGRSPKALAAVNRLGEAEVELLLKDESFQELVAHYRTLAALPEAEKLAALRRKALDLMELALDAGDVRVAIFFANEELHGRDPGLTLAKAALRAVEREAGRTAPVPERRPASRPPAAPRREADFPYCAATQPGPVEAAALAAEEARRFESRLATTRRSLTGRLLAEAEREGTAEVEALADAAEAFARDAHGQGGQALPAAAAWQARRDSFAEGRVSEPDRLVFDRGSGFEMDPRVEHGDDGGGGGVVASSAMSEGASASAQDAPIPLQNAPAASRHVPAPEPLGFSSSSPGSTRGSRTMPAHGRHPESVAGTAAPLARDGPAPPVLPDWVDRVPGANRPQLLAMPEAIRAETLQAWARFYGFDTG
jgi:hypothetical protein